jgi:hypothetical protein
MMQNGLALPTWEQCPLGGYRSGSGGLLVEKEKKRNHSNVECYHKRSYLPIYLTGKKISIQKF